MTKLLGKMLAIGITVCLISNTYGATGNGQRATGPALPMAHCSLRPLLFGSEALGAAVPSCKPRLRGLLQERFPNVALLWGREKTHLAELLERYPTHKDLLKRLCSQNILDSSTLLKALKDHPAELDRAIEILAENPDTILAAFINLIQPSLNRDARVRRRKAQKAFAAAPSYLISALGILGDQATALHTYLNSKGTIDFDRFLVDHASISLTLYADSNVTHYAAQRFIDLLDLDRAQVVSPEENRSRMKGNVAIAFRSDLFEAATDGQSLSVPLKLSLYHSFSSAVSESSTILTLLGSQPPPNARDKGRWLFNASNELKQFEANQTEARLCAAVALAGAILRQKAIEEVTNREVSLNINQTKIQAAEPVSHLKDILAISTALSVFFIGVGLAYYFFEDLIDESVLYRRASFAILAVFTAISASLLAQWLHIRQGTQKRIEAWPIIYLTLLALVHSTIVEAWAWEKLEQVHIFPHPFVNAVAQTLIDYFGLSLILATAWAMFFYGRHFDPQNEAEALKEIREKLLGFYVRHEWKWAAWILPAMLAADSFPLLSFAFFQAGVLTWNVVFDYGDYPDSWEMIRQIEKNRWAWWLAPAFRFLQRQLESGWYIHFLKNTLVAAFILAIGDFFYQLQPTHDVAPLVMLFAAAAWIAWLLKTRSNGTVQAPLLPSLKDHIGSLADPRFPRAYRVIVIEHIAKELRLDLNPDNSLHLEAVTYLLYETNDLAFYRSLDSSAKAISSLQEIAQIHGVNVLLVVIQKLINRNHRREAMHLRHLLPAA